MLSVTKARVNGIDQDVTKTGEDRRLALCPRAVAILERQLRLRERAVRAGIIRHDCLFFTDTGAAIQHLGYGYWRWHRTLKRLAIRYRKPYVARHTSVSWNLMAGRNPLLVAKEHGHRLTTMLTVYAAWAEGAVETDIVAIQEAMNRTHRPEASVAETTVTDAEADIPSSASAAEDSRARPQRAGSSRSAATPARRPSAGPLPRATPLGSGLVS